MTNVDEIGQRGRQAGKRPRTEGQEMVSMKAKVPACLSNHIWHAAVSRQNSERRSEPLAVVVEELVREALEKVYDPPELSLLEVTIREYEPDRKGGIVQALNDATAQSFLWTWDRGTGDELRASTFDAPAMYELQDFAAKLAEAGWRANNGYCRVTSRFCFLDKNLDSQSYMPELTSDPALVEREPWRGKRYKGYDVPETEGEIQWEFPATIARPLPDSGEAQASGATA